MPTIDASGVRKGQSVLPDRSSAYTPEQIHPDEEIPTNQKYLLYVPPEAPGQESEYYVTIVRVLNAKTVAFLTAYDISPKQYQKFAMIGPRIFPPPQPKRKKR